MKFFSKDYETNVSIQRGRLFMRRWQKRSFFLMIGINLWIDSMISYGFEEAIKKLGSIGVRIITFGKSMIAKELLEIAVYFLLLGSILFWIETFFVIRFLVADSRVHKHEKGKHHIFPYIGIAINVVLFAGLMFYTWWR